MSDQVVIVHRRPTADEYRILREGANWPSVDESRAVRALTDSIFGVVAEVDGKAIGMARLVSEGGKHFYVFDVIVLPSHRQTGLATLLVESVVDFFDQAAAPGCDAVLSLIAEPQLAMFYAKFGFQRDGETASILSLRRSRLCQRRADIAD